MDNHSSGHSIVSCVVTVILWIIFRFTLSDWAGVVTIIAGLSTFGLNIFKYLQTKDKKDKP